MVLDNPNYKTAICKSVLDGKTCDYKNKCNFAHSEDEMEKYLILRRKTYKTSKCKKFHQKLFCSFGEKCHHIHYEKESEMNVKVRLFQVYNSFEANSKSRKECFPKLVNNSNDHETVNTTNYRNGERSNSI